MSMSDPRTNMTSETRTCDLCHGSGQYYGYRSTSYVDYRRCPQCDGRGQIVRYISHEAQMMAQLQNQQQMSGIAQAMLKTSPSPMLVPDKAIVIKEKPKPVKSEYSLNNLDFRKLLIYSFLGLAVKTIADRSKKDENNAREIGS